MRWSIVRLIWLRELRDQLRDRRTVFMIAGLPLLLYPVLGFVVLKFAMGLQAQPSNIGIVGGVASSKNLPERGPNGSGLGVVPPLAWMTLAPATSAGGFDHLAGAVCLAAAAHENFDYPLLVDNGQIAPELSSHPEVPGPESLHVELLHTNGKTELLERKIDALLIVPPYFFETLDKNKRPTLQVIAREGDDASKQAVRRLNAVLSVWRSQLKDVRLARRGLPFDFDEPVVIHEPELGKAATKAAGDLLVRVFPFLLVMWSLAGALYPAVDLCAGEKERGTMETLLISPAGRDEIVLGKFLTIWVFSAGTALLNLFSMGVSTWQFRQHLPHGSVSVPSLLWSILLLLPLSAFFSAVSLAVGAYARSSKEGQYYLMPLFLVTMPLIFLTLAPGVQLNPFYAMMPVTGVGLLMQRLMTAPSLDQVPWFYFGPVLAPIILYSWLALRWAIEQFQREEVLFREAERLDVGLWLRRLFRDKEATPTVGQAMFCFGLLLALRWLSEDLGSSRDLLARSTIIVLSFIAAPTLFMAVMLTTRPRTTLNLRWPALPYLLAGFLLLPLADVAVYVLRQFPAILNLLQDRQHLIQEGYEQLHAEGGADLWQSCQWLAYLLAIVFLPAICKEVAFRGLILTGLRRRFQPWSAVLLSSFLFAVFHMNVFMLLPAFVLGVVLGLLALRSGSIVPGIVLHGGCNFLLMGGSLVASPDLLGDSRPIGTVALVAAAVVCTLLAGGLLLGLARREPAAIGKQGPGS